MVTGLQNVSHVFEFTLGIRGKPTDVENDPPALTGPIVPGRWPCHQLLGMVGIRLESDQEMVDGDGSIISNQVYKYHDLIILNL